MVDEALIRSVKEEWASSGPCWITALVDVGVGGDLVGSFKGDTMGCCMCDASHDKRALQTRVSGTPKICSPRIREEKWYHCAGENSSFVRE
jgi:hypothetical protein